MRRAESADGALHHRPPQAMVAAMQDPEITTQLEHLRVEHRDLDDAIAALQGQGTSSQLQVARLKRRKLRLRDEIAALEDQLIPDIIA